MTLEINAGCKVTCNKFLTDLEVSIYLEYIIPQLLLKIVKMWQKQNVSENVCDGERQLLFQIKRDIKSLAELLRGRYLPKVLQTSSTVKISKYVVKKWMF